MIKFCWTKACPLCGAALKLKYSLYTSRCNSFLSLFCPLTRFQQSNDYTRSLTVFYSRREAIMAEQVIELVEDLTSYYGAKVKTEDLSNTLTPTLSKTAQRRSSSVVSNRSIASITDKFGVALLTKPAILNNANVALVDAVHYSVVKQFPMFRLMTKESQQKLEENYFKVMDALMMTLIEDDDDLLGTVNSHIKLRRLGAVMLLCQITKLLGDSNKDGPPLKRCKTEAADSRYAKASRGRTKKDKDSEDSDTGSDVLRLRRRDRAAARARSAERKRPLDSDDYRSDSSLDIDSKDDLEDEEATTAKDLAREQKERLKALLNAKTRDSLSARVGTVIEHCTLEEWTLAAVFFGLTDAYILYFKELLSDNSGIFANAIGIGKTRAIVLAVLIGHVYFKNWTEVQNAQAEGDAIEYNAVNDDDKLFAMDLANSTWCDLSDPLALRFCFFSDSPPENIGRPTKEEAMEMRIDTTNAISKALAAANKLVALQSYTIPEANTPAVHSEATKHCLALLAARFVIVCGFRKVDKHVFRAYNTISVTAQQTIIRKGGPHVEKRAILLPSYVTALSRTPIEQGLNEILIFVSLALISLQNRKGVSNWFNATDKRDSVTSDRIYKIEDARNIIANVKHDASEHESSYEYKELISQGAVVAQRFMLKRTLKTRDLCLYLDFLSTVQNAEQQCRDILEKEGLDESEASRRVIFNCFEMQAIASYPALATLKAAYVKDLFTNLSKDYFLVREARAITKSSPKFQNLSNLCSELGLREKFGDESVLVMQGGMTQHEINLKLAKWRDLDRPWIIVALMAFAEAITLTEATHVLAEMCVGIVYFNLDSELELKVLGKQNVKTTS
ncbi:hypothetical protein HBI29_007990 [Parastagonospora nodorum]|nr:hypothetical protein HBI29_007990 [Parastagonospora nodorum]